MSTAVLGHAVLGHMVLGQVGTVGEESPNNWILYRNSTAVDPRGLAIDPLREVVDRETIIAFDVSIAEFGPVRFDVLACGHRFPTAGIAARVADGRLMRRCPLDYDTDEH